MKQQRLPAHQGWQRRMHQPASPCTTSPATATGGAARSCPLPLLVTTHTMNIRSCKYPYVCAVQSSHQTVAPHRLSAHPQSLLPPRIRQVCINAGKFTARQRACWLRCKHPAPAFLSVATHAATCQSRRCPLLTRHRHPSAIHMAPYFDEPLVQYHCLYYAQRL